MKLKPIQGKVFHIFNVSSLRKVVYDEEFDVPVVFGSHAVVDGFVSLYLPDDALIHYYSKTTGFIPNVSFNCDIVYELKPNGSKVVK